MKVVVVVLVVAVVLGMLVKVLCLFYVLVTSKIISEQVPTCDSVHSW